MKSGKAVGPDDIPVEVWKCLGEAAVEFLTSLFNRVLENLEKAYDRVPREELWYCMRKSGVAEKYVRVVQDMYERSRTVVRCAVGQTEEFKVEVGLHQGSALSPFLFAIVMDQLSEEVRQESPWTMMFADDIVICSESREQVEENLERWRFALERRGMKVSRSKTEYMCVNEREGSGTVRLQGEEVKKVQEFKYLGSTVQSNGECGKEVKKRVQAGWNGWRKVTGVLCDRKISARIEGKVYRTVVRPAMLYGLETESELEVAELKMLRFSLGVTRLDRIRNEYIRGTAHVGRLEDKVREARLRWFGHVQRRESAAPDAPNPSPSQKVRSSDGSWGGARNVERPVGGARSRVRHLGGGREAKARRVGGSEDQGEASGGNEDQGKAHGGSEKQERDKWGEQRTRRQGQRVRRDVHNRAEAPNDVHSRAAEPSDVHSRAAGPSDVHRRAAAPSDVHRRALAPSDVHRRTTAPGRRCPSRWGLELPKGREGGSKVLPELSSAGNRKSTTDAIFTLRILMEKYRDGQRELHCVFVDLEKAYDRGPREELWYCMRKSGVAEKYVRVVQDMYERSRTVVRCAVGQTEEFKVEVGLHQGSALSPFLFAIVMDQLSEEVRQESPWTMMFADDIVICSESREQVEENLERWRFALERRGMKVSRSKTEYMCVNEREGSGTVRLQGEEVKKVQEFKYLGSTVQSNGECGKEGP
ncbi:hypothetical protein QTP70_008112 [Hemibagrus guttatus]|uniref:ribonuclease H n=1 Tax=Hemibagrus guttatus TaxID=175788 RepID=A0AAE0R6L1_9TELE|nr:hypothetical protein QTP70_008112 [Hemibagrus guttatus]